MKQLIYGVVAAIIAGFFLYFFTLQRPELIYTLSDPIILLSEEKDLKVYVQQLEVKNIGDSIAQDIKIFIKASIVSYEIVKYSNADEVKIYQKKDSFEANYPSLRPQGNFKLTIKSFGIPKELLNVSHSGGLGKDAIEAKKWTSPVFVYYIVMLIYTLVIVAFIRDFSISRWDTKPNYQYDEILKGKRPFYYTDKRRWESLRKESLNHMVTDESNLLNEARPTESQLYKLLFNPKPNYLSNEEWDHLITKLEKAFTNKISSFSTSAYHSDRLLKLLKLERPLHFSPDKWIELKKKIDEGFMMLKRKEFSFINSPQKILTEIKSKKPEGLKEDFWNEYLDWLKKNYYTILSYSLDIELPQNKINYIKSHDLSPLEAKDKERLENRAYHLQLEMFGNLYLEPDAKKFITTSKPDWVRAEDYNRLYERAQKTLDLESQLMQYNTLNSIMKNITASIDIGKKKPDFISTEEWETLVQMDNDVRIKKEKNMEIESQLKKEKEQTQNLKNKVEKQLEIINIFLKDPIVLDRIEDYNQVFSPGNLENLGKIATLLSVATKNTSK